MFGTGQKFKVARVAGIPIYVSYSWFAIAALFAFVTYASFTTTTYADEAGALTAVTLILFFGSVLLHEGAHAVAARGFGLPVRGITLVFWGGATETRSWRRGPSADFVVAAAGPATTLAIGLLFVFIAEQMTPYTGLHDVIANLGHINLLFAGLNAIPGFPLDGGRMLMALAWGITRKRVVAYRVAGAGSLIVGAGFIVWGFLNFGRNGLALFAGYLGFVMISVGAPDTGAGGIAGAAPARHRPRRDAADRRDHRGRQQPARRDRAVSAALPRSDLPGAGRWTDRGRTLAGSRPRLRGVEPGRRGDDPVRRPADDRGHRAVG